MTTEPTINDRVKAALEEALNQIKTGASPPDVTACFFERLKTYGRSRLWVANSVRRWVRYVNQALPYGGKPLSFKTAASVLYNVFGVAYTLPEDVASWMTYAMDEQGRLRQSKTAHEIAQLFGDRYVEPTLCDKLTIISAVREEFRQMNPDVVYRAWGWERRNSARKPAPATQRDRGQLAPEEIARLTAPGEPDEVKSRDARRDESMGFLATWLDDNTVAQANAFVEKERLRSAYGQVCLDHGHPVLSQKRFTTFLMCLHPEVKPGQRRVNGRRVEVFVGLGTVGNSD